jgi:hypothetical protein
MLALVCCVLPITVRAADEPDSLGRQIYPIAPAPATVPIVKTEFEGEPSAATKAWAERSVILVRQWWPLVCQLLATEQFKGPKEFKLRFQENQKGPAHRTEEGNFISVPWITKHPDDFGMVIHEMTHAIQDYHNAPKESVWLVEGIADYIRYWRYEPDKPHRAIDATKATYRDGYSTTAAFLAWIMWRFDRRTLHEVDAAFRSGTYQDALFEKITGKPLDDLWRQFLAERPA